MTRAQPKQSVEHSPHVSHRQAPIESVAPEFSAGLPVLNVDTLWPDHFGFRCNCTRFDESHLALVDYDGTPAVYPGREDSCHAVPTFANCCCTTCFQPSRDLAHQLDQSDSDATRLIPIREPLDTLEPLERRAEVFESFPAPSSAMRRRPIGVNERQKLRDQEQERRKTVRAKRGSERHQAIGPAVHGTPPPTEIPRYGQSVKRSSSLLPSGIITDNPAQDFILRTATYEDIPALCQIHLEAYIYDQLMQLSQRESGESPEHQKARMIPVIQKLWKENIDHGLWPVIAESRCDKTALGCAFWGFSDHKNRSKDGSVEESDEDGDQDSAGEDMHVARDKFGAYEDRNGDGKSGHAVTSTSMAAKTTSAAFDIMAAFRMHQPLTTRDSRYSNRKEEDPNKKKKSLGDISHDSLRAMHSRWIKTDERWMCKFCCTRVSSLRLLATYILSS
jgi:hypothetical protein